MSKLGYYLLSKQVDCGVSDPLLGAVPGGGVVILEERVVMS